MLIHKFIPLILFYSAFISDFFLLNITVLSTFSEFTRHSCNKIARMVAWFKHLARSIELQFVWSLPDTRMSDEHLTKTWQFVSIACWPE